MLTDQHFGIMPVMGRGHIVWKTGCLTELTSGHKSIHASPFVTLPIERWQRRVSKDFEEKGHARDDTNRL
jgi:hypothetical protein